MLRRHVLLACAAALLSGGAAAQSAGKVNLRFADVTSADAPRSVALVQIFAKEIGEEFTFEPFFGGTLYKQSTELVAVQRGNLEMANLPPSDFANQAPEFDILGAAYVVRDAAHLDRIFKSEPGDAFRKIAKEKLGVVVLAPAYYGVRHVNLKGKKRIQKPEDLAGVKLRMPGGPDWLLLAQSIGATPTPMGMPEVYVSLQTGTIDGQENPPTIFNAAKFHEVSKQMVLTSHLVQPIFYAIAKPYFDKLKPDQQKKLREAAVRGARWNDDNRLNDEKTVIEGLAAKGLTVSRPDLGPFRANADRVYAGADAAKAWDRKLMEEAMAVR